MSFASWPLSVSLSEYTESKPRASQVRLLTVLGYIENISHEPHKLDR